MRHPGSGPQHTLSPQPSLTDGRGEKEGGGGEGRGSGGCILTIPRSILSSLNLPSFLPSLYPIYPFPFSSQPLPLLLHPFHFSSLRFFISSSLCLHFHYSIHPLLASSASSPPHLPCAVPPVYPPCFRPGDPGKRKMIPEGTRGVGGRLCPWSRCLTWAKPAKQPPCLGSSPGCKPGQRGQTGGAGTGDGRAGAVHRGDMPSKTNHQLHFFTQNIICLSVLPFSPVSASTRQQSILCLVFLSFPSHLSFLSFCVFLSHRLYP